MNGLEKIIERILSDARKAADDRLSEAQKQVQAIQAEAKAQAEAQTAEILEQAEVQTQQKLKNAESAAALEGRSKLLSLRRQEIDEVFKAARQHLLSLDDSAYFDMLQSLIKANALPENGELLLSKRDIDRMPPGFMERVNQELSGKLTLSANRAAIDGGVVLQYGGVEQNCSFDAMLSSQREQLEDLICRILF